jgi:SCY1-like protein 1
LEQTNTATLSIELDDPWAEEAQDTMDAWGTIDDEGDNFFDAPSSTKTSTKDSATAFDDGGEPDFAGWLAAQSKAKTSKPLPKGLNKTNTASSSLNVRPAPLRSVSAGVGTAATNSKKPIAVARSTTPVTSKKETKKEAPKPKEPSANDDDWGDAWD